MLIHGDSKSWHFKEHRFQHRLCLDLQCGNRSGIIKRHRRL